MDSSPLKAGEIPFSANSQQSKDIARTKKVSKSISNAQNKHQTASVSEMHAVASVIPSKQTNKQTSPRPQTATTIIKSTYRKNFVCISCDENFNSILVSQPWPSSLHFGDLSGYTTYYIFFFIKSLPSSVGTESIEKKQDKTKKLIMSDSRLHQSFSAGISLERSSSTNATTTSSSATSMMEREVLGLNQRLLDSIANGDYETYSSLCAMDMTCIEPETNNLIVKGQQFHKYYFDLYQSMLLGDGSSKRKKKRPVQVTMVHPTIQLFIHNSGREAVAIVAYVRLDQVLSSSSSSDVGGGSGGARPTTIQCAETRVWSLKEGGAWLNNHFHRSELPTHHVTPSSSSGGK